MDRDSSPHWPITAAPRKDPAHMPVPRNSSVSPGRCLASCATALRETDEATHVPRPRLQETLRPSLAPGGMQRPSLAPGETQRPSLACPQAASAVTSPSRPCPIGRLSHGYPTVATGASTATPSLEERGPTSCRQPARPHPGAPALLRCSRRYITMSGQPDATVVTHASLLPLPPSRAPFRPKFLSSGVPWGEQQRGRWCEWPVRTHVV